MTRKEMIEKMIDCEVEEMERNEPEIRADLWVLYGGMTDEEVEEAYEKHLEKCLEENFECRHGDVFTLKDGGKYILALVAKCMVALVSMRNGNRWVDAISVEDSFKVKVSEFGEMCGSCDWKTVYKTREPYGDRMW